MSRFNPGGVLTGATFVATAGHRLYMTTPRGLYVINVSDPMNPRIEGELTNGFLRNPRCVTTQWRYAFVTDDDGMKVLDITNPARPAAGERSSRQAERRTTPLRRAHLRLRRRTARKASPSSTSRILSVRASIRCSTPTAP